MKPFYILMISLVATYNARAEQTQSDTSGSILITLDEIWNKVSVNSKSIQKQKIEENVNLEEVKDAKSDRLPDIKTYGEYARVSNMPVFKNGILHTPTQFPVLHNYYKVGTSAYLNVFSGSKTNIKIAERKTAYNIAQFKTSMTVSEIKLRAAAYYLEMQRNLIFESLLKKDIEAEMKQLKRIKALQINGSVLKSDVLRSELKLSRQGLVLEQIQNDLFIANDKLNTLIDFPVGKRIQPTKMLEIDLISIDTYNNYINYANDHAYKVQISKGQTELSRLQIKDVKANLAPKVGLFADYAYSYPQIFLYPYSANIYGFGMAGIKASFSLSAFYQNNHKQKIAKLGNNLKEVEYLQIRDELREDVNEAYLRYRESVKRVRVSESNVKQAIENRRIINNTYFNHTSLITDLIDADTQLLETQFDLASAKISAQLQYYQLLNITGKL